MLKTFTGFRGTAAMVRIGKIRFFIIAETPAQLEALWQSLLTEAGPFDPTICHKAILVEAKLLPESHASINPSAPSLAPKDQPPIDV